MSDDLKIGAVDEVEVVEKTTPETEGVTGVEENDSWKLGAPVAQAIEECESCSA